MATKEKIIGIDLGTTNSCVAVMEGGTSHVILNNEGGRTTPSVVAFSDKEKDDKGNFIPLVGASAKRQAIMNPTNTITSIKRYMGKQFSTIQTKTNKDQSYQIFSGPNERVEVRPHGRDYTPEQISAFVLQKMKTTAEAYLGHHVKKAVITVPAYFNDTERQATKDAGKIAGLEVMRIINEPTAAALAYGLDKKDKEMKIAVFDLGGGTFDISLLELGDSVFDVKATNGDVNLGGDDFDAKIIDWLLERFQTTHSIDLSKEPIALQRIKEEAEKAKKELSNTTSFTFELPFIATKNGQPLSLQETLSRTKFEGLTQDLVERTLAPCRQALADAKLSVTDIDEVILVGGSTRIPKIQETVKAFFNKTPSKSVNPDEVVAMGAAIQGAVLAGDVTNVLLLDVIPASVGIETMGGIFTKLIEKNTTIPTKKSQLFSTAQDNQTSVDINVFQGERSMAQDNRFLGRFTLQGIKEAPRGTPQIDVAFDVDANGILSVSAKDKQTGKENKIRIESASNLSKEEIAKMEQEAAANEQADKEKREKAEKLNTADALIAKTEKQLKEFDAKLSTNKKESIQTALGQLKQTYELKHMDKLEEHSKALANAWASASEEIYQANQTAQKQASSNDNASKQTHEQTNADEQEVTDAEFEEVKDDNK